MNRICALVVLLGVSGCAHTYYLGSLPESKTSSFQKKATSSQFDVHLSDGSMLSGTTLQVKADSIVWLDALSGFEMRASTEEVEYIGIRDRTAGGVEGFMLGFIGGAVVGGLVGYSAGESDCPPSELCFNRGGSAVLGAAVFGLSTALFGGIYGALRGTRDSYYLGPEP